MAGIRRSVLGSWVGVRRLFHISLFLAAPRVVLPKILVLTRVPTWLAFAEHLVQHNARADPTNNVERDATVRVRVQAQAHDPAKRCEACAVTIYSAVFRAYPETRHEVLSLPPAPNY